MRGFIAQMAGERRMQRVWLLAGLLLAGGCALAGSPRASGLLPQERVFASEEQGRLTVNDFSLWDRAGGHHVLWASVSVKHSGGNWVTGLTLDDFELTEALISPSQEVIEERTITFDKPYSYYQFDGDGFWERSVTAEKLDIVFAIDSQGSMEGEVLAVNSELHDFVDRLRANHVDFRIGVIKYDSGTDSVDDSFNLCFHGVMEAEEIHEWIDKTQTTWGGSLEPTVDYDAVMFATQFGFREAARKIIVVITDSGPQTLYGNRWRWSDATAATMSAVEVLLENSDFELLYSQPDDLKHLPWYAREDFNPRALNTGFDALEGVGLAQRIPWPFQQEDIAITGGQIADSQYYFAWMSGLELPNHPENYTVRVTIKVADPERPGEFLEAAFSYVPYLEDTKLTISVTDEAGEPTDEVWLNVYAEMGDRKESLYQQYTPEGGQIVVERVPLDHCYLLAMQAGRWYYRYDSLGYIKREHISVGSGEHFHALQVETTAKEIELAKARGALKDLRNWGYVEKPFAQFADEALSWLDAVEEGGVDWKEIEAVKRFYIALSGYVNTTGYAEVEVERAVEDFIEGSKEVRKLLKRLTDTGDDLTDRLENPLTLALLALYTALLEQEAIADYFTEEVFTKVLVDYVKGPLIKEVVPKLIDALPVRSDLKNLLKTLVETIVFGEWHDWEGVVNSAGALLLNEAVDEIGQAVSDEITDDLFSGIVGSDTVKSLVKEALMAIAHHDWSEGFTFDSEEFESTLQKVEDELPSLAGWALDEIKDEVASQVASAITDELFNGITGSEVVKSLIKEVCMALVNYDWRGGDLSFDSNAIRAALQDLEDHLQSLMDEALDEIIDEIIQAGAADLADELFDYLDGRPKVVSLAKEVFVALAHFDWSSKDFTFNTPEMRAALDDLRIQLSSLITGSWPGDLAKAAFDGVLGQVDEKAGDGPIKDFMTPVVRLFVQAAVEWVESGGPMWWEYIDPDAVAELFDSASKQLALSAFDEVLNQMKQKLGEGPVADLVVPLVRVLVQPVIEEKVRDQDAVDELFGFGSTESLLRAFDAVFDQIEDRLDDGPVRDFIVPIVRLFTRTVIEKGGIDDDTVVEVLARLFCNWMALRPYYSQPLLAQMNDSLRRAQHFTPEAGDHYDRWLAMREDFGDFRGDIMQPLNDDAWDALEFQDSIDDWESLLSGAEVALNGLEVLTVLTALYYPPFWDKVDDIHDLISILEGLRVMTNIFQFGCKLENMASLRQQTQYINPTVLPKYLRVTTLLPSGGAALGITWRAQDGMTYRVQWKHKLADAGWNDLSGDITASGDSASYTDTGAAGATSRFYRVMRVE